MFKFELFLCYHHIETCTYQCIDEKNIFYLNFLGNLVKNRGFFVKYISFDNRWRWYHNLTQSSGAPYMQNYDFHFLWRKICKYYVSIRSELIRICSLLVSSSLDSSKTCLWVSPFWHLFALIFVKSSIFKVFFMRNIVLNSHPLRQTFEVAVRYSKYLPGK